MATTPNLVLAPGTTSRCNAFLQHPFEEVHWGALLAGLVNETLRVEWPADMDPLLRKTGEACTHIDPARRPVSFILSKVGSNDHSMHAVEYL